MINATKTLLDRIISWEKDLSEYPSLESILKEQFIIFERTPTETGVVQGIEAIARERQEQLEKHGRTIELDVENNEDHQLVHAASILCTPNPTHTVEQDECPAGWDEAIFEKMVNKSYEDRLVIAGALIAAEIDRIRAI